VRSKTLAVASTESELEAPQCARRLAVVRRGAIPAQEESIFAVLGTSVSGLKKEVDARTTAYQKRGNQSHHNYFGKQQINKQTKKQTNRHVIL
jgi:hypothetical protein